MQFIFVTTQKSILQFSKCFRCDVCDFTSQVWLRVVSHRLKKHNLTTEGFKVINCPKEGCQFKTVQEVELEKHTEAVHDKIKFQVTN